MYCLQKRTVFIRRSNNPRFPAHGRFYRKRPHMLFNDLPLPVSQFIFRFRILQRSCRMVESVQPVRIFLIRLMPVIQKIIVKQCPSYQISWMLCSFTDILPCCILFLLLSKFSEWRISQAYRFNSFWIFFCFLKYFLRFSLLRSCRYILILFILYLFLPTPYFYP